MTQCIAITNKKVQCSNKTFENLDVCFIHKNKPKDKNKHLDKTKICKHLKLDGKRCTKSVLFGEDSCSIHIDKNRFAKEFFDENGNLVKMKTGKK